MPFYGPFALGEVQRPVAERRFREQVPNISGFSMDMPRNTLGFSSETPGLFGGGAMPSTFGQAIGALPQPTNPLGLSPKVGMFEGTSARPESLSGRIDAGGETGPGPPGAPGPGFGEAPGPGPAAAPSGPGPSGPTSGPAGMATPGGFGLSAGLSAIMGLPSVTQAVVDAIAAAITGVPPGLPGIPGLPGLRGSPGPQGQPDAPAEEGPATTGLGLGPPGVAEGAASAASSSGLSGAEASTAAEAEQGEAGGAAGGGEAGTVICTELYRQGRLSASVYRADARFGEWLAHVAPEVLAGYYVWAPAVVRCMSRSRAVSAVVAVLARPWTREMARCVDPQHERGSLIGAVMMALGWRLCARLGQRRAPTPEDLAR